MQCPDCRGTTKRLVPVPWTRGQRWVAIDCTCDDGYVAGGIDWSTAFSSLDSPQLPER